MLVESNSVDNQHIKVFILVNFVFFFLQLVASADCAGALDITDDLQQLLVFLMTMFSLIYFYYFCKRQLAVAT